MQCLKRYNCLVKCHYEGQHASSFIYPIMKGSSTRYRDDMGIRTKQP